MGLGLQATQSIRPGDVVLMTPPSLQLGYHHFIHSPIGAALSRIGAVHENLPKDSVLPIASLLLYYSSQPTSHWTSYLAGFPSSCNGPLSLSQEAALSELRGSTVVDEVLRWNDTVQGLQMVIDDCSSAFKIKPTSNRVASLQNTIKMYRDNNSRKGLRPR